MLNDDSDDLAMLPPSVVDSGDDFDWQELFGESPTTYAPTPLPTSYPPEQFTFSPSPIHTEEQSPVEPSLQFNDYLRKSSIIPTAHMPIVQPRAPFTDGLTGYPSPMTPDSSSGASPSPQINIEPQYTTPANILPRRRGPGRPSKAQLMAEGIQGKRGRNSNTLRREIHNDSAMRSRARFNTVLDQLWAILPEKERAEMVTSSRTVCRAEKIEVVISYIERLQREVECRDLY